MGKGVFKHLTCLTKKIYPHNYYKTKNVQEKNKKFNKYVVKNLRRFLRQTKKNGPAKIFIMDSRDLGTCTFLQEKKTLRLHNTTAFTHCHYDYTRMKKNTLNINYKCISAANLYASIPKQSNQPLFIVDDGMCGQKEAYNRASILLSRNVARLSVMFNLVVRARYKDFMEWVIQDAKNNGYKILRAEYLEIYRQTPESSNMQPFYFEFEKL